MKGVFWFLFGVAYGVVWAENRNWRHRVEELRGHGRKWATP
jgi:hypothetical protein